MSARRATVRAVVAVAAGAALLSGCSSISAPDISGPGRTSVEVDTPELRALKATTKIEPCAPGDGTRSDDGLPSLTLNCLGGGDSVDISSLRGPLVINLWASWCGPCERELPIYQEFYEKHGDKVGVLGIDFQDNRPAAALELAKGAGVTYPQLADANSDLAGTKPMPPVPGLPAIAFVDAEGRFVVDDVPQLVFREIKSVQELEELVAERLGVEL
ncbi:TlpA disulfide reductase family protein [Nocardioides dubius]|uniref:TlpA disulfide reductase family protein n=1 Tax=Nocardioides dubius TaxID=317019 RepID=A0ABP4EI36_9ACTN